MQEIIVYIIILITVGLVVWWYVGRSGGKETKEQGACGGCPLKDNCGKRTAAREHHEPDSLRDSSREKK